MLGLQGGMGWMFQLRACCLMMIVPKPLTKFRLSVDVYKYCGCWYSMPADLYDCANVILEIRPNALTTSTIPTSILLSTALLTGPILPASVTTQTLRSATSTAISIVAVEPQPPRTVYATSTVLVTDCGVGVTNCPVITRVTSYPVPSTPSTGSLPPITPTPDRTLPVSSFVYSASKTTVTAVSIATQTLTATITSCPPTVTDCPWDYSSLSIYTSTIHKTIYSCDGGCDEKAPPNQVCVPKTRIRLVKRGEP